MVSEASVEVDPVSLAGLLCDCRCLMGLPHLGLIPSTFEIGAEGGGAHVAEKTGIFGSQVVPFSFNVQA